MRCFKPISLKQWDPVRQSPYTNVPCGRCEACLSNKRREWLYRLNVENRYAESAHFITLTYDEEHLPRDGLLKKDDVQRFLKRLRKFIHPFKIRYFYVGEYGEKLGRPHYHMLLFNFPKCFVLKDALRQCWSLCSPRQWSLPGVIGQVSSASINYCAKYCVSNLNDVPYKMRNIMGCSKRPAIGSQVLNNKLYEFCHQNGVSDIVRDIGGYPLILPRYYKDKLFTDDEKMILKQELYDRQQEQEEKWKEKYGDNGENSSFFQKYYKSQLDASRVRRSAKKYKSEFTGFPFPKTKSEEAKEVRSKAFCRDTTTDVERWLRLE